MVCRRWDRTS